MRVKNTRRYCLTASYDWCRSSLACFTQLPLFSHSFVSLCSSDGPVALRVLTWSSPTHPLLLSLLLPDTRLVTLSVRRAGEGGRLAVSPGFTLGEIRSAVAMTTQAQHEGTRDLLALTTQASHTRGRCDLRRGALCVTRSDLPNHSPL